MNSYLVVVATGSLLLLGGTVQAGVIHDRQARQNARIDQGVASGALTPHEADTLFHSSESSRTRVIGRSPTAS